MDNEITNQPVAEQPDMIQEFQALQSKEVCRNARCTFFFVHFYTNRLIFFMLRKFEDLFDLCVPNI